MALRVKTIFCVIDPTTVNQRALRRAAAIATDAKATLHVYVCVPTQPNMPAEDRDDARAAQVARHEAWLREMVQPLRDQGLGLNTEVECHEDWRSAIATAAKRTDADLIVKSSYRRTAIQRRLLKTSDWTLLRTAECPVLFVKTDRVDHTDQILAAVNLAAENPDHQALNDLVLEYASVVAKATGAELHAVNAYSGSLGFIHPPDLARRAGIERSRAHVGDDAPEKLIAEVAHRLGSPLVVIGSLARKGIGGAVVGNTAERILDGIDTDVVILFKRQST
jgi:universal stress protein E